MDSHFLSSRWIQSRSKQLGSGQERDLLPDLHPRRFLGNKGSGNEGDNRDVFNVNDVMGSRYAKQAGASAAQLVGMKWGFRGQAQPVPLQGQNPSPDARSPASPLSGLQPSLHQSPKLPTVIGG